MRSCDDGQARETARRKTQIEGGRDSDNALSAQGSVERDRVVLFDVWRLVGVGLVVFVHLLQRYKSPLGGFFGIEGFYYVSLGGVGVTLLLILSGAVLEYNYGRRHVPLGDFMRRRLAHLYPAYWVSIACAVVLFGRRPSMAMTPLEALLDWTGLIAAFGKNWSDLILPTSWFLAVIIPLYLLFPLLSKTIERRPTAFLLTMFVVSVAARLYAGHALPGSRGSDWFLPARIFEFSLGIWIIRSRRILATMRTAFTWLPTSVVKTLARASSVSFPLYLIHWAVLRWSLLDELPAAAFIPVALIVSVAASVGIHAVSTRMERVLRGNRPC